MAAEALRESQAPDNAATAKRFADRRAWTLFGAFACLWVATSVLNARAKPFWHDEIYTVLHAGLPTVQAMWSAALDGLDLSPPLNTWLTRAVHAAVGVGHVTTRIPPMAGYLVMSALVFHMLRKRANTIVAFAGVFLPCSTAAYRYSYEARPYGLMVGLFALALHAWSEAAAGRRRVFHLCLLAGALSASVWNHYYGVLTFVPIAGGEVVRWMQRRRPDAGVLAAIGAALGAGALLRPLAVAASAQSSTFWSSAASEGVRATYAYLFAPLMEIRFAVGAAAIAGLVLWSRFRARWSRLRAPRKEPPRTIPPHEIAAGVLALAIPVLGIALGMFVTGVFVPRYAMTAVVGASLVVPLAVWRQNRGRSGAEFLLCAGLAMGFGHTILHMLRVPPVLRDPFASRTLLRDAIRTGSPVVVAGNIQFLQLWYYAPPAEKGRLRYLADLDEAQRRLQFDTVDRGYLTLRRWTAVPIEPYAEYVAAHPELRVYVAGGGWLLASLDAAGATQQELGREPGGRLLLVRMPRLGPSPQRRP